MCRATLWKDPERDFSRATCKTSTEPRRLPDPPWRCHNTRLPGPPQCWPRGDQGLSYEGWQRIPSRATDTSACPSGCSVHALKSWNLKGKLCTLIKKKKKEVHHHFLNCHSSFATGNDEDKVKIDTVMICYLARTPTATLKCTPEFRAYLSDVLSWS